MASFKALNRILVAAAIATASTTTVVAQQAGNAEGQLRPLNSIEVLVNDEPISTFDINQRLRLVIAISGGVRSEEEFMRVREQVIRSMVDERLQLQEASERGVDIPGDQLDSFFARRAQGLGQSPEQFEAALMQIGSSKATVVNQLHAEFAWSQLVNGMLGRFADASTEEVQTEIERLRANKGKFEYRLQEIVLLVSDPSAEESVGQNAQALVDRIRDGAPFGDLAQQFSASSSAAVGGEMGWATADKLPETYLNAISATDVGEVTDPIRTPGGFTILFNRDRRRIMTADPLDTRFVLEQLWLPLDAMEDEAKVSTYKSVATQARDSNASCEDIKGIAAQANAVDETSLGAIRLRQLEKNVRDTLMPMEPGQSTEIMEMEDGLRVLFVCGKEAPTVVEPEFEEVLDQLTQQRLSMMARRFLRDLRRDAIVDYR